MLFKNLIYFVNKILGLFDIKMVRKSLFNRISRFYQPSYQPGHLPKGAENYLQWDNPRLLSLKQKYGALHWASTDHTSWTEDFLRKSINLKYFRGDNAYIYQLRDGNREASYLLTTYYIMKMDKWNLLNLLKEDGLFGNYTYKFGDLLISRDLLDSIVEIYFLEKYLKLSEVKSLSTLDVGAGYGRLAHRLASVYQNIGKVFCVDAVAESTFLCEYYLRFRYLENKTETIPLYDIETILSQHSIYLATNVCSFSECSTTAIEWWIELLKKHNVKYLLIVPDSYDNGGTELLSKEKNGEYKDFQQIIESKGYRLIVKEPKYQDEFVQNYGLSPTYHYLFEMSS